MRLNALVARTGPATSQTAKRQKRADVLESLGLDAGGGFEGVSALGGTASRGTGSMDSLPVDEGCSSAAAVPSRCMVDPPFAALCTPPEAHVPLTFPTSKDREENTCESGGHGGGSGIPHGTQVIPRQQELDSSGASAATTSDNSLEENAAHDRWWEGAFVKTDQWNIDIETQKSVLYLSERDLRFEWDHQAGRLFQYFADDKPAGRKTAGATRELVWSSECPDVHVEVWESLPLPGDAHESSAVQPELDIEPRPEQLKDVREGVKVAVLEATAPHARPTRDQVDTCNTTAMPPPPLPMKRRSSNTDMLDVPLGPDLVRPANQVADTDHLCDATDEAASSVLSMLGGSDDEDTAPTEKCELPSAPSEKAEPTALDLELDMFSS